MLFFGGQRRRKRCFCNCSSFAASGTMSALAAGLGVGGQIVVSVELTFKIAGREVALDKLAETLV